MLASITFAAGLSASAGAFATGLATCDSGPRETWQPQAKLEKMKRQFGMSDDQVEAIRRQIEEEKSEKNR